MVKQTEMFFNKEELTVLNSFVFFRKLTYFWTVTLRLDM